jgi:hypothetical protein
MVRVELYFETLFDPELKAKVEDLEIVRLKTLALFERLDDVTDIRDAIVDTGAFVSLIPQSIWKHLRTVKISEHEVAGLSPKPECAIPVIIGKVNCVLLDKNGNTTQPMEIYAYFAKTDKVPLIIGFKDLLTKFTVYFDYGTRDAYVEIKE